MIASNSHAAIGSLRSINALEIATVGFVRFVYPVPPSVIVNDEILDDVETKDVTIHQAISQHLQIFEHFFLTVLTYQ